MGREFTNALSSMPLWRFAISTYSSHKTTLLDQQTNSALNVNVLLTFAFAQRHGLFLSTGWHADRSLNRIVTLVERQREIRRSLKATSNMAYTTAKHFEVMLEGTHLMLLNRWLSDGDVNINISAYEDIKGVKKGAIAPLIKTLIS